jgi:hypothetical protein
MLFNKKIYYLLKNGTQKGNIILGYYAVTQV